MTPKKTEIWFELDLLRGLAVMLMLINHSIVGLTNFNEPNNSILFALFFIGSYAPVVFFFVTGVGYGLAHQVGRIAPFSGVLYKAGILILADIFLRAKLSTTFPTLGLDFLGFIGVSMIILHCLRGRRFGVWLAILLIPCLFLLRFAAEKIFGPVGEVDSFLSKLTGQRAFSGFSYWLTPWLIYPLLGFLLGVLIKGKQHLINKTILATVALFFAGFVSALISYYFASRGMVIFRWGTVSFNFFVSSIACLFLLLSVVCSLFQISLFKKLIPLLSIRGIASLAIVPIHYVFLDVCEYFNIENFSTLAHLIFLPVYIYACFMLAAFVQRQAGKMATEDNLQLKLFIIVGLLVCAAKPNLIFLAFLSRSS